MGIVGSLGDIVFEVSADRVNTIDSVKWESSTRYAEHTRHNGETVREYIGTDSDTISFTMYFSASLGVNPIQEYIKILDAERRGDIMMLVIGPKAYGRHRWVILKSSKMLEKFDRAGNLIAASATVTLGAYSAY